MNNLLTIEQARLVCNISFEHAWSLVQNQTWTPVLVGPGAKITRVRETEVLAYRDHLKSHDAKALKARRKRINRDISKRATPGESAMPSEAGAPEMSRPVL